MFLLWYDLDEWVCGEGEWGLFTLENLYPHGFVNI